jgi:hypothetical protein
MEKILLLFGLKLEERRWILGIRSREARCIGDLL